MFLVGRLGDATARFVLNALDLNARSIAKHCFRFTLIPGGKRRGVDLDGVGALLK